MQKRIFNVLLVATPYDAFMLERTVKAGGTGIQRVCLAQSSLPPRDLPKVANYAEALRRKRLPPWYDLVIAMPEVDVSETFREAQVLLDELYPHISRSCLLDPHSP